MADSNQSFSEEDLLSDAIPIDDVEIVQEEDALLADAIPIDQVTEEAPSRPAAAPPEAIDLAEDDDDGVTDRSIRTFSTHQRTDDSDKWNRTPQVDGKGAVRCRTFVAKLRLDAIEHLDEQINEWLEAHPDYEIKFAVSAVGELTGKIKEPALFVNVFI